ncbi:hypothetical protein E2C01_077168 [Portunus trituberculatus]|uniref:Uncharacterized protein n=1 Tax=Portunus trituberculatus TaxID=210409 RepID=A0A5B7ILG3_PORTR|nr:hypothetical protein [Portunus trituberculatus]
MDPRLHQHQQSALSKVAHEYELVMLCTPKPLSHTIVGAEALEGNHQLLNTRLTRLGAVRRNLATTASLPVPSLDKHLPIQVLHFRHQNRLRAVRNNLGHRPT